MASGWIKSLHCKSRAFEDVYHPSTKSLLSSSASCRKSVQSIKDVIEVSTTETIKKHRKPKPSSQPTKQHSPSFTKLPKPTKQETLQHPASRSRHSASQDSFFPALTELPEGHPSRNVVEIIFHTSWSPKAFMGRIEMIFKVQNASKTVARFEEYREMVKARAGSNVMTDGTTWEENARCVADGNEVMRFHCLGPSNGGTYDACGGAWVFPCRKGAAICTFSGSGGAHESAGGGKGRRAMLVCRVIAGRVSKQLGIDSLLDGGLGFDSVSGDNGELLVFDPRAVLPCFLIIYRL